MNDISINDYIIQNINSIKTELEFEKFCHKIQRKYKETITKRNFVNIYNQLKLDNPELKSIITKKNVRSHSGVVVITIFTSAYPEYTDKNGIKQKGTFSCKWDCHYCPNEPANERNGYVAQPRSYLYTEPGVLRANDCNFICTEQMNSRMKTLMLNGHIIDKLEILVLGGTWCNYPEEYQREFIRDIYYSANIFMKESREKKSLEEEIKENEKNDVHIIGLTLETRPDTINMEVIKQFREYGCTRVQLGMQHTNNDILKKINRGHTIETTINAIRLLKKNAFKVDIHIMPNLPGTTIKEDNDMFEKLLYNEDYQADQWKIYPCAVTPYTKIEKWYNEGLYEPYSEENLFELIKNVKLRVPEYIRLNRIIRDISSEDVLGGYENTNMRQLLQFDMKKNHWKCRCIRCREIKNGIINDYNMRIDKYRASKGIEYFISLNNQDNKLIGFLRLRINDTQQNTLDILKYSGIIRELHIYGKVSKVGTSTKIYSQHKGFGKMLLDKAEEITRKQHNLYKTVIISGVGVRGYYEKHGYKLEDTYMIKKFWNWNKIIISSVIIISILYQIKRK